MENVGREKCIKLCGASREGEVESMQPGNDKALQMEQLPVCSTC